MTVEEALKDFEAFLREKDQSPATVRSYLGDIGQFCRWYFETAGEQAKVDKVGPLDVAEFKRHLLDRGMKAATVNRRLAPLGAFFGWAQKQGYITRSPVDSVKAVREARQGPKSLGRSEQIALMRAVQKRGKVRDIAIVTLLLHTGLRVSELCALTLEDVALQERSGHITVRSGKGMKHRTVPLNATARKALRDWLSVRGDAPGPLFLSQKKRFLSSRAVERLLSGYARDARLEGVTPHVLRHTFCKSLIDAGESIDRVAVLAGHSNVNTTARYTRPNSADLQKGVERLAWE